MQRSTLTSILGRLPLLLRDRYKGYADRFWINKYNDLMGELERTGCGPWNSIMVPVPFQLIQSNELLLPAGISDIKNLYLSTGGEVRWESNGSGAHILETIPVESQIVEAIGQFTGSSPRMGRDVVYLSDLRGDVALGDAIVIHSSAGPSQPGEYNPSDAPVYSWVASYLAPQTYHGSIATALAKPMQAGELDFPMPEPAFYWTFRNFLIVEGHRAYHRITTSDDLVSLSPEWDDLTESYLRFHGEVQTDQTSKDSSDWGNIWQVRKKQWMAAHTRQAHAAKKPSILPSMTLSTRR